jgi:hypothetical protein
MRLVFSIGMSLAAMVVASTATYAQGGMAMKMEKIQGVLVDTKCYGMMPEQNAGNDHMVDQHGKMAKVPNCAAACAAMGIPVAVRTSANQTIVLAAPANQLSNHMAQQVTLVGMYSRDKATFIVTRVEPQKGQAFDIKTMM